MAQPQKPAGFNSMTILDDKADLVTEIQQACRKARVSRRKADLEAAAKLLGSASFTYLPDGVQEDLHVAYAEAVQAVTGGLVG